MNEIEAKSKLFESMLKYEAEKLAKLLQLDGELQVDVRWRPRIFAEFIDIKVVTVPPPDKDTTPACDQHCTGSHHCAAAHGY